MMNKQTLWFLMAVIVAMATYSLLRYPALPPVVPTHYTLDGQVDASMPREIAIWVLPGLTLGIALVWVMMPLLNRGAGSTPDMGAAYPFILRMVVLFLLGLHVVMLSAFDNPELAIRLIMVGTPVLLVIIGNELPRLRQNRFIGVRTPWTFADERVWRKTNRIGARMLVIAALVNLGAAVILPLPVIGLFFVVTLLAACVGIVGYSYRVYQQVRAS